MTSPLKAPASVVAREERTVSRDDDALDRARETMRERFESELSLVRDGAKVSEESARRELAAARAELENERRAKAALESDVARAREESNRLAESLSDEKRNRDQAIERAVSEAEAEFSRREREAREALARESEARAKEVAEMEAKLTAARAEFEAHRKAESGALSSQIAQQTTIQHNLVQELTEAKTAEVAAKTRASALELRVAELAAALDVAQKQMAIAAKEQNEAVLLKEKTLGANFGAKTAELERECQELRVNNERVRDESARRAAAVTKLEQELKQANDALAASAKAERESTARAKELEKELERARAAEATRADAAERGERARSAALESRVSDLEIELKMALERYEKNESEYQRIIEDVTARNEALTSQRDDASTTSLEAQNARLKKEVDRLSKELAERDASDDGGIFGALLGRDSSHAASLKRRVNELETLCDSRAAAVAALESQLRDAIAERDAARAKLTTTPSLASFLGLY